MIRRKIAAFMLMLPCVAIASSFGNIEGRNEANQRFLIYPDDWNYEKGEPFVNGGFGILIYPSKKRGLPVAKYNHEPCELQPKEGPYSVLICSKDGHSPLAGVTYKVREAHELKRCVVAVYICVKGCQKSAPMRMEQDGAEQCE